MPSTHEFELVGDSVVGFLGITNLSELPFEPVRFFWINGTPSGITRGQHAHKRCDQFILCLAGEYKVSLSHGHDSQLILLRTGQGLHIPPGIWGSQTPTSDGSVLGVFASLAYSEDDYIRDFNNYLDWLRDH